MRRHVAAVHFSVSGPSFVDLLDPRRVLVGAGPAIPPKHRSQYSHGVSQQNRFLLYFEFEGAPSALRPNRIHLLEPHRTGAYWYEDCVLWTAEGTEEMEIVPITPGANGKYVGRSGGLRFVPSRPPELDLGRERANARFYSTVQALAPEDLAGQNMIEAEDGTDSWWQHSGFLVRKDGPAS
jgi:hypothetical protein